MSFLVWESELFGVLTLTPCILSHLAGAWEMVDKLNWFGKSQGITLLYIQMGKRRLKELVDVFALCFVLYQGLSLTLAH